MPASWMGADEPPWGDDDMTSGIPASQMRNTFSAVSFTICSGLLNRHAMNEITGLLFSSSAPPATSSAMWITSSNFSSMVSPACTCLVMWFRLAKNLLASWFSSVTPSSWILTGRMKKSTLSRRSHNVAAFASSSVLPRRPVCTGTMALRDESFALTNSSSEVSRNTLDSDPVPK